MNFHTTGSCVGTLITLLMLVISVLPGRADERLTARNKGVVREFYATVLIGRDVDAAPRFLLPDYIQHNPQVPTGLKGFMDTFRARFAQKLPADYKRELLNVIGENDMVVTTCARLGLATTVNITKPSGSTCSECRTGR